MYFEPEALITFPEPASFVPEDQLCPEFNLGLIGIVMDPQFVPVGDDLLIFEH